MNNGINLAILNPVSTSDLVSPPFIKKHIENKAQQTQIDQLIQRLAAAGIA